jgi:hypothetical protein
MIVSRVIDKNLYINGRRKENEVNTDLDSYMGIVSVMSLKFHSTMEVSKHIPVCTKLKEGIIRIFINYY